VLRRKTHTSVWACACQSNHLGQVASLHQPPVARIYIIRHLFKCTCYELCDCFSRVSGWRCTEAWEAVWETAEFLQVTGFSSSILLSDRISHWITQREFSGFILLAWRLIRLRSTIQGSNTTGIWRFDLREEESRHNHTRRTSKKRSRTKNALAKMCRAKQRWAPVERTCVRNQPLILGSIYIFF